MGLDTGHGACYRASVRRTDARFVFLEVLTSVPVAAQTVVPFPARRHPLCVVEDAPQATVRDISTAPSACRRLDTQRGGDPSFLRTPVAPRRHTRSSCRGIIVGASATAILSAGTDALGLAIRPAAYDGPTMTKAVVSGNSM